ncbi:oligosaccharide flippase family protein [Roseobacter litoralis]|uniref:oligosaccharide flippase family protein n=1 Tax=Roseobacter litoralis TaxID=42443 RepID=UPI00248FBF25|nr:oligosaccharide flippase family protein [Roseobacter litoralis]
MISRIKAQLMGKGVRGRALRGTLSSVLLASGSHVVRFASNLVLTRLLFPEAFGLMALVQVIVMGLEMLSTFGLRIAVMQNARGDEPDFLNTAWTLQVIRGILLWLLVCSLSPSFANFYDQPILAQILPVASFTLVIRGFFPTKILSVQRKLQLGRYSMLTLVSQVINVVILSLLAYWLGTVWALVIGGLISPAIALVLFSLYLPGIRNRFRLEGAAMRDMLHLGKYLFISTIATYVITQSDRAVLGLFIPIDLLGIYGIAFALATLPAMLATTVAKSVVFPLYRMRHPADDPRNQAKIFRTRRMVASAATALSCGMAYCGPWIMDLLYDDRYSLAGPIAVLLCVANVPLIVLNGAMNAALSKGDSLRFMLMNVATAICQLGLIYIAVQGFGIAGAALAIGLAPLLTYPLLVVFLRHYNNWDPVGELGLMGLGFLITGGAVWLHWDRILLLMT